jgi:outer membrane protein
MDDLSADMEAFRNETLQKSTVKMGEVVKKLAEEKGFDLVVDSQTTLYFKPAMELTTEAIAAYNKAYPAAAPPSAGKPPAAGK